MALKEKLAARKESDGEMVAPGENRLSVLANERVEQTPTALRPAGAEDTATAPGGVSTSFAATKAAIHGLFVERHADEIDISDREGVRSRIASLTEEYMRVSGLAFNRLDYGRLVDALLDEILGFGPLQPLLEDQAISEIMINHPRQVYGDRAGRVPFRPAAFEHTPPLLQAANRICARLGRLVADTH